MKDEAAGLDFGHQESRDGDVATGEYNVLLPDGRKQVVQYEADSEGYKPKISYEGSYAYKHIVGGVVSHCTNRGFR